MDGHWAADDCKSKSQCCERATIILPSFTSVSRRSPAHCIEYAKIILWPREHQDTAFDPGECFGGGLNTTFWHGHHHQPGT